MHTNEIYKIYGTDYTEMTRRLLVRSDLASRIPAGARVGIKPNLVSPTPAEYGATTHSEVVAGIIEYLQENGITNVIMLEGSWIGDKTSDAYEYCGYRALSEKYGVPFVDTQKDSSTLTDCQGLDIRICDVVKSVDFMINVPVMKGHGQTKITCALKNMKGLIPNTEKRHFHTMGLHKPIAHLSRGIRQDFIVVDHICGDLELEDGGNPITTNCIMTALDPVMMDSYVCHLLGFDVDEVPYIRMAEEMGSGSTDLAKCRITVLENDISEVNMQMEINPVQIDADPANLETNPVLMDADTVRLETPSAQMEGKGAQKAREISFSALDRDPYESRRSPSDNLLDISYAIEDADSCSACYASLAPAILRLKEEGLYEALMDKLPGRIAIGQGFAGKTGEIGVGNCCRAFNFSIPGCPPEEEDVYQALLSYIGKA